MKNGKGARGRKVPEREKEGGNDEEDQEGGMVVAFDPGVYWE